VTAAYPRRRAIAESRGRLADPLRADADDEAANASLRDRLLRDGFDAIPCVGTNASGSHSENSFWVWDVAPIRAAHWARFCDQFAIVAGDGRVVRLVPCFPEYEPSGAPDVALLLHEPGDSSRGIIASLERELAAR